MKKKSSIGGLKTAKRKILVREFFEKTLIKVKKYSDPFENDESVESCDESEWNIKPLKINLKKNHKLFEKEEEEEEETQLFDDILVKNRDLAEADRFIASLKLPSHKIALQKENSFRSANFITDYNFKETYEKFKTESERLNLMLKDDDDVDADADADEFDDFII